jgi:hypothetical protein
VRLARAPALLVLPLLAGCWAPVCLKGPDPLPFRDEALGYRCERDVDCREGKCVTVRPGVATCSAGDPPCPAGTRLDPVEQGSPCLTSCRSDADCRLGTIAGSCRGCAVREGVHGRTHECGNASEKRATPFDVTLCRMDHCESDDSCPAGYRCVGGLIRDDGLRTWASPFDCHGAGFCQVISDR